MPELPEVEVWREKLERWLAGKRIVAATAPDRRLRGGQSRRAVEAALAGATVRAVARRGKFLTIELAGRRPQVLIHLGMTGAFARVSAGESLPRFTRAVLELARRERIAFVDARRLGAFRLVDEKERRRLDRLGVEPLGPTFTASKLFVLTRRSKRSIKTFLMDQHRIAGLGNIHAGEALFRAGIHPERPAGELTREEARALARAVRAALRAEIRRSGFEPLRYLHEGGENAFLVYGRDGDPCPRCRTPIAKILQSGRSSYYCPRCQVRK